MSTILGVPGAWTGAWAFASLTKLLAVEGHDLRGLTLKGMGEDYHPGVNGIGVTDHVKSLIAKTATINDPITLLAWSYGGLVVAGALPFIRQHIAQIIFLDAIFPIPGRRMTAQLMALHGKIPPWLKEWNTSVFGDVLRSRPVAAPPLAFFGAENTPQASFINAHLTPAPANFRQGFTRFPIPADIPMSFIRCTTGAEVTQRLIAPHAAYAALAGWPVYDIAAPHAALITDSIVLANRLTAILRH